MLLRKIILAYWYSLRSRLCHNVARAFGLIGKCSIFSFSDKYFCKYPALGFMPSSSNALLTVSNVMHGWLFAEGEQIHGQPQMIVLLTSWVQNGQRKENCEKRLQFTFVYLSSAF